MAKTYEPTAGLTYIFPKQILYTGQNNPQNSNINIYLSRLYVKLKIKLINNTFIIIVVNLTIIILLLLILLLILSILTA